MSLPRHGSAGSSKKSVPMTSCLWRRRFRWVWAASRPPSVWLLGTRRSLERLVRLGGSGTWWMALLPCPWWFRWWWRGRSRSSIYMGGRVHVVFGNCLEDGLEILLEVSVVLKCANELFEGEFFFSLTHKNNNRTKLNIIHYAKPFPPIHINLTFKMVIGWRHMLRLKVR